MARPYWLLSLIPVIGEPLAFWLQNRELIRRAAEAAGRGYDAGGFGGSIMGVAEGLGHGPGAAGYPGTDNALGEAIEQVASDPSTDPRVGEMLASINDEPTTPK